MTTSSPACLSVALGLDDLQALVADRAGVLRVERRLLGDARRRAADVERAHRQLRARLADRLRGDDADRLAELDQLAGREVAAVALRAARRGALAQVSTERMLTFSMPASWIADAFSSSISSLTSTMIVAGERIDDLLERRRGR